jgi:hypothetical protein
MNDIREAARHAVATFDRWLWMNMDEVELVKAMEALREALKHQDAWDKEP